MIVEDIQTDVAATVDKARKLVQSDNVDLVMGPIGSDANDAAYAEVVEAGESCSSTPRPTKAGNATSSISRSVRFRPSRSDR